MNTQWCAYHFFEVFFILLRAARGGWRDDSGHARLHDQPADDEVDALGGLVPRVPLLLPDADFRRVVEVVAPRGDPEMKLRPGGVVRNTNALRAVISTVKESRYPT